MSQMNIIPRTGRCQEHWNIPYNVTDEYNSENWSLSRTLEYAFDDFCIAEMAAKMGRKDIAETFYARSQNYRNVYNPATSFMQPKDDKGNFIKDFHAEEYTPQAMHGIISGLYSMMWMVLLVWWEEKNALARSLTVCLRITRRTTTNCLSLVQV